MNSYELIRSYLPDRTIGRLGEFCTLELPWLDNHPETSCIPEGSYHVLRDHTGKFQVYAIHNVPGRSSIEMHVGNYPKDSKGCILIGSSFMASYDIANSVQAVANLIATFPEEFTLVVRSYNPKIDGPR